MLMFRSRVSMIVFSGVPEDHAHLPRTSSVSLLVSDVLQTKHCSPKAVQTHQKLALAQRTSYRHWVVHPSIFDCCLAEMPSGHRSTALSFSNLRSCYGTSASVATFGSVVVPRGNCAQAVFDRC